MKGLEIRPFVIEGTDGAVSDAMGRRMLDPRTGVYFVRETQVEAPRRVVLSR